MYIHSWQSIHVSTLSVSHLFLFLETEFHGMELTKQARLGGQQAPRIFLSSPPPHWDYKHVPPHLALLRWVPGIELRSLCFQAKASSLTKLSLQHHRLFWSCFFFSFFSGLRIRASCLLVKCTRPQPFITLLCMYIIYSDHIPFITLSCALFPSNWSPSLS